MFVNKVISLFPSHAHKNMPRKREGYFLYFNLKTLHFTNVFIFCIKSNTIPPFIALFFLSYYGTSFLSYTVV